MRSIQPILSKASCSFSAVRQQRRRGTAEPARRACQRLKPEINRTKGRFSILRHIITGTLLAAGIALTVTAPGQAQDYPTPPVKVAVPYSAGGGKDVVTRDLSQYVGEGLNQKFIVENRRGANASIGAEGVETAKPVGHTWLAVSGVPLVLNEASYEEIAY